MSNQIRAIAALRVEAKRLTVPQRAEAFDTFTEYLEGDFAKNRRTSRKEVVFLLDTALSWAKGTTK